MPSTPSPLLRLELMGNGDQPGSWGTTTNTNLGTLLEGSIAGLASVSVSSTSQALLAVNYSHTLSRIRPKRHCIGSVEIANQAGVLLCS